MTAAVGAASALPLDTAAAFFRSQEVELFHVPLRIPRVLKPVLSTGARDYYETTMRPARVEILPGKKTGIWGFDGRFPGPTLKVQRGREVVVRRKNALNVPTSTHLHGGRVPPRSDGQPHDLVFPGEQKDYVYPNEQEAATLWYHDHTHHHTSRNNYMGLAGLYIIEDEAEGDLNLPKDEYDIPLVLHDRSFKADGSFRFKDKRNRVLGDVFLVNGRPTPYLEVANRKYRFRILNASHTRGYKLALDSGAPLIQIASDGGLLTAPAPATNVELWPAERAEVVIDFSTYPVGTSIVLQHQGDPADPESVRPLMRFDVTREESDPSSLPLMLRPIERITTGTVERTFRLSFDLDHRRWEINGKPFNSTRVDAEPKLGDTEIWTFENLSSTTHPMHLHLVQFQILSRGNGMLTAGEMGWKDTVRVDPSSSVRIGMKFEGFTGRYVFHCHNLAHEDHSMMAQMRVIA